MNPRRGRSAAGIAATLAAAVLWGSSFSVNDIGLRHVGPGTFVFLRFALAGIVTLGVLALMGRAHTGLLRHRWFWGLCLANALAFLLQYAAQQHTTPARTALFVNTSAFTVALLERVLFGMRLGWRRLAAIGIGTTGAGLLLAGSDPAALAGGQLWGDVLAMLAGIIWSVYFVYNDRAVESHEPIHLIAWTFAGTAAILVVAPLLDPFLASEGMSRRVGAMDAQGALAIVYSGIVTTALAFGLWAFGLARIRASISALLLMVEILVASMVSLVLARERFGAIDLAGAALLLAAIMMATAVAGRDAQEATAS